MRSLFVCLIALSLSYSGYAQSPVHVAAQVSEVTVFTNGAEVVNTFQANLPRGTSKLIVQNVANDIDERSIQLGGPNGVTVLSIAREKSNNMTVVSPAHRQLKDSLDAVTDERQTLQYRREAAQGALKILKNDGLLSGDGNVDISALGNLVDYYQKKSVELNLEISRLNKEIAVLDRQIEDLNQRIRTYVGGGSQIAIQLVNDGTGTASMTMTYRTNSASWQPYYDVRATSISSPLKFAYKARITQSTGVDWNNVKLVLSTGNPSQSGDAPLLQPNYVTFNAPYTIASQNMMRQNVVQSVGTRARMDEVAEVAASAPVAGPTTTLSENQLSASFEIDMPYDILSNGQPHSVNLQSFEHPTLFKYYAVPKADKDAFLLAEVKDYQSLNLMPGEANIFFENMYVGKSFIDPNITTDTLNLSMGRDKSISIKRERVMDQRSTQVSGSTKRQTYTYEIRVRNNKSTAINMLLKDQYPVSTDRDIVVNLQEDGGAAVNSETGILTWMISVQPGETKTYRFQYQIRHPRDREVYF